MKFSTTDKVVNWTVCTASLMLAPLAPAFVGLGALYYGSKAAHKHIAKPTAEHLTRRSAERKEHEQKLKDEEIAEQQRQRYMFDLYMSQLQDVQTQLDQEQRQNARMAIEMLYRTHTEIHERLPEKVLLSIIRQNLSDQISPAIFRDRADRISTWLGSLALPAEASEQPEGLSNRIAQEFAEHMERMAAFDVIPDTDDYEVEEFREAEINRFRQWMRDEIERRGGQEQ